MQTIESNSPSPVVVASARDQFDRQAALYNNRWASWSDETLRALLAFADPQGEWNALDIATGTGFTALALAPHVRHIVGADLSPGMLAQARKRADEQGMANTEWVECAAELLPFADGAFDLATVRIAPHHFGDVAAFLRETYRVLKPGGVFVLCDTTVPDDDTEAAEWQNSVERERDPSHVANLSPRTWQGLCEQAGFSVTDVDNTGGIPIPLSDWLETAGATGERAERVRALFAHAPASAVQQFQIHITPATDETDFVWQRVVLRAVK